MSSITHIREGIHRWDGIDADHGFPIVGYVVPGPTGTLLVDPPGTSGTVEELRALGEPQGILLTNRWHVRGAGHWKRHFGVPIAAPASAAGELAEVGEKADVTLRDGDEYVGWKVLHFSAPSETSPFDELAYWHAASRVVILGDLITAGENGTFSFGPNQFSGIPVALLTPFVDRLLALRPQMLLSAHIGPRTDATEVLVGLKANA